MSTRFPKIITSKVSMCSACNAKMGVQFKMRRHGMRSMDDELSKKELRISIAITTMTITMKRQKLDIAKSKRTFANAGHMQDHFDVRQVALDRNSQGASNASEI